MARFPKAGEGAFPPRKRRWLRIVAGVVIASIFIVVAVILFAQWRWYEAEKPVEESNEWARKTTHVLRTLPGGEKLRVCVLLKYRADGPDWFFLVVGPVLDEETDRRMHIAFDAMGPPQGVRVRWSLMNCGGDAEMYKQLEAEPLEIDPSHVLPPRR